MKAYKLAVCKLVLIFLLSSLAFAQETGKPVTVSADEMTNAHNAIRQSAPGAAPPIPNLSWDPELATSAGNWATQCKDLENSVNRDNIGENVATWQSPPTPQQVVDSWAKEALRYDYPSNKCDTTGGGTCLHYTQIVWSSTTKVGCGAATCSYGEQWVCQYSPRGNSPGEWPYFSPVRVAGKHPVKSNLSTTALSQVDVLADGVVSISGTPVRGTWTDPGQPTFTVRSAPVGNYVITGTFTFTPGIPGAQFKGRAKAVRLLGVGTDGRLWTRASLTSDWELIPASGIIQVAIPLADGRILGVVPSTADFASRHRLIIRESLHSNWSPPIPNSGFVISVAPNPAGGLVGVGESGYLWTLSSLDGKSNWKRVNPPDASGFLGSVRVRHVAPLTGGRWIGVDGYGYIWKRETLTSDWKEVPNSRDQTMWFVVQLPNGAILGAASNRFLYTLKSLDGQSRWQKLDPSGTGQVQSVYPFPSRETKDQVK